MSRYSAAATTITTTAATAEAIIIVVAAAVDAVVSGLPAAHQGGGRAVTSQPSLGGLVAGGRVAGEVCWLCGSDVLGETEVAQASRLALAEQEDILGLFVRKNDMARKSDAEQEQYTDP